MHEIVQLIMQLIIQLIIRSPERLFQFQSSAPTSLTSSAFSTTNGSMSQSNQPSDCRGSTAAGILSDPMTNLSMCNMFSAGSAVHNAYSSHHFGSAATDLLSYNKADQRQLSGGMCS